MFSIYSQGKVNRMFKNRIRICLLEYEMRQLEFRDRILTVGVYLTSMKSDSEDEDHSNNDGDDVERNHGDGSSIIALEDRRVTELYQENVDNSHGTKE